MLQTLIRREEFPSQDAPLVDHVLRGLMATEMNSQSARLLSGANCFLRTLGKQLGIDDASQGRANDWS